MKKCFVALLRVFSKEYVNVQNYVDVQNNFDFDIAIQKLHKKEFNWKKKEWKWKKMTCESMWKLKQ